MKPAIEDQVEAIYLAQVKCRQMMRAAALARIPDGRIAGLGELMRRKADAVTAQLGGALPDGWAG